MLENPSTRNPDVLRILRRAPGGRGRRRSPCLPSQLATTGSMLFAGTVQDLQVSECRGLFVAKKKRVGITLLASARSLCLRIFQVLPGFSRPAAGRIYLKILFPGLHRHVPCLGLLMGDSEIKKSAGAIVTA